MSFKFKLLKIPYIDYFPSTYPVSQGKICVVPLLKENVISLDFKNKTALFIVDRVWIIIQSIPELLFLSSCYCFISLDILPKPKLLNLPLRFCFSSNPDGFTFILGNVSFAPSKCISPFVQFLGYFITENLHIVLWNFTLVAVLIKVVSVTGQC